MAKEDLFVPKEDLFVYKYKYRSDLISKLIDDCLREMYNLSFPKTDFDNEIVPKCREYNKDPKYKQNGIKLEGKDGKKYGYPYDFYYIPKAYYCMIEDNYKETYAISGQWKDNVDTLKEYINNEKESCIFETSIKDEFNISQRKYVQLPGILEDFKKKVDEETAQNLVNIVNDYINKCKNFYKFGIIDENHFNLGVANSSPSSNREKVKNAWKEVFDVDIEIPDDSTWTDEYDERLEEDFE